MSISEVLGGFVSETTKSLVDSPDDVNVIVSVSTKNVIIQIQALKSDIGKVIGKKGRTIEALKILTLAIKNTKFPQDIRKVSLEVLEDENSSFNFND